MFPWNEGRPDLFERRAFACTLSDNSLGWGLHAMSSALRFWANSWVSGKSWGDWRVGVGWWGHQQRIGDAALRRFSTK